LSDRAGSMDSLEQQSSGCRDYACGNGSNHFWPNGRILRDLLQTQPRTIASSRGAIERSSRGDSKFMKTTAGAGAEFGGTRGVVSQELTGGETEPSTTDSRRHVGADFAELVKARLTALVLLTTAVGIYLG